jgi:lipoate-protein ligase A
MQSASLSRQFTFLIFPDRSGDAFQNMADDIILLEYSASKDAIRFRHYNWKLPACSFGYGQNYNEVNKQFESSTAQLCRRPTGGGLVDHRNDWTYSLVLPPQHPLIRKRALTTYRLIHMTLADALNKCEQPAVLAPCKTEEDKNNNHNNGLKKTITHCFQTTEPDDVINPRTDKKIAGAALKRNRYGMLIQGSIDRSAIEADLDYDALKHSFIQGLCSNLEATPKSVTWLYFPESLRNSVHNHYATDKWNKKR